MGITSLQVCMDSSDWLQDTIPDDCTGMDHSSSPPVDDNILTCNRPLIERRLRPQHEQALKCPRCDSTHTKFCYYNNYSLSQPRYFCKTCRRYWTKGGTLRNIPVGGGCRKNKKVSSNSKKSDQVPSPTVSSSLVLNPQNVHHHQQRNRNTNTADIQLAFPEMANPNFGNLVNPSFLLENSSITPIDFMENKYDNFMGNGESFGGIMGSGNSNFHGICSPFGFTPLDHHQYGNNSSIEYNILGSSQKPMIQMYDENHYQCNNNVDQVNDVKPNAKILSLEWNDNTHHQQQQQQQACNSDAGNSFGYNFGGLGSWTGLMNGYGPSATNPLV